MTRPATMIASVALAAALATTACGGGSGSGDGGGPVACTSNADDYIPAQVAGQDVQRKDDVTSQIESSLQQDGVDSVSSGVVSHVVDPSQTAPPSSEGTEPPLTRPDGTPIPPDDPTQRLPDIIMVAGVGQGVSSTPEQFEQMKDQPDTQVDQTTIDGVDITTLTFPKTELQTAISFGSPCETVFAISFAFKGGREAAELGMKAMLDNPG